MSPRYKWNVNRARQEGFKVAIGHRLTNGPLLRASGHHQSANAVSDFATLTQYAEVEFEGLNGAPSIYIASETLIEHPQFFVGYDRRGLPLFLGIKKVLKGHLLMLGPTQCGKSTTVASIARQATRMGLPVAVVGLKDMDSSLIGSLADGARSLTRFDKNGNLSGGQFAFITLKPGARTGTFNPFQNLDRELPTWHQTAAFLKGLNQIETENNPSQAYFVGSALKFFQRVPLGDSIRDLNINVTKLRLDRDTLYSTAAARNQVEFLAAIEQMNGVANHPANVDLVQLIKEGGAVYFDACFMDTGAVATSGAGLFVTAAISAKRIAIPGRDRVFILVLDEAQQIPRPLLKQIIEQSASSGIRVIMTWHTLQQMEDDAETLSMTAARMIFGAVPGSSTDRHLQALFGTTTEYAFSFSNSGGADTSTTVTHTTGPVGSSISVAESVSEKQQMAFSFVEREVPYWKPNDTLELNYDRDRFVLQVSPAAELAYWGPRPIVCQRGGTHLNYDDMNRIAEEVLRDTKNTILPGQNRVPAVEIPAEAADKRRAILNILNLAATRVRTALQLKNGS